MSQDVFITVQPFTGDQINVSMDTTIDPPVLSVNSKVGHILLEKSDIGLGNVDNVSALQISGYLQSNLENLENDLYQSGIGLKSKLDTAVFITGNQQINGEKYFNNLKIIDYLIGNNILAIDFQTGIYQHSLYLEKIIESNSVLDFRYPPEGNFQSVFVLLRALPNNPVQVGYENIIWRNDPPKSIIEIDDPALFFTYKVEDPSPFGTQTYGINLSQPSSLYNTVILSGDQSITGIKNFINIPTINGNNILSENSATITNLISDLSDLTLTGQSLQQQIDSLDLNYASDLQLSQTGSTLQLKIDNLSGYSNSAFATILNLASTGQTLQNQIDNLDNAYASDIQLSQTGQSLNNLIDSLSGAAVLTYGTQVINGLKVFRDTVYIKDLYVTGTETIVNTTNTNVGNNYLLLNATGGAIDAGIFIVTGIGLTGINDIGAIIGYDVPANRWVFGNTSRGSDLNQLEKIAGISDITNYSGFVDGKFATQNNLATTGSTLQSSINTVSSNLATTGSTLQSSINTVSSNLATTGSTLQSSINTVSSNLATTGSTLQSSINTVSSNLSLTGLNLNTKIDNLSGYSNNTFSTILNLTLTGSGLQTNINNLSGASVLLYGNQTITGSKNFITRPSVNNVGVLISGDDQYVYINQNSIIAYENTIYNINFDGTNELKASYASGNVSLNGRTWSIVEGLIGLETGEIISAPRSLRMRGYAASNFTSLTPLPYGLSAISFQYKAYSTDLQIPWLIQYDVNQNNTWTNIGTISGTTSVQTFLGTLNQTGQIRIRISGSGGGPSTNRRINMDNFIFYPASNVIESPFRGTKFLADTSSQSFVFPLPSGNQTGFYYTFADPYDTWGSNNFILSGVNNVIEADGNLFTGDINGTEMKAIFVGKNDGWRII